MKVLFARLLFLSVLVACVVATATATATRGGVAIMQPLPFDHQAHSQAFAKRDVTCLDCHPIGMAGPDLRPPLSTCHACHLRELKGTPRNATNTCASCHPVRADLVPESHDRFWLQAHAREARSLKNGCRSCHEPDTCVDCHDRRGALVTSPHGPGFTATHGIEARMDPSSCSRCHTQDTCTDCHANGTRLP